MRRFWVVVTGMVFGLLVTQSENSHAQGPRKLNFLSGTYLDPALQRQDILPHTITSRIPEHREVYNRPRYLTGKLAYHIEPSSQEAMAWQTNYCNGNYRNHAGRYMPYYYYPKPWEALNTAPRPGGARTDERMEWVAPQEPVAPQENAPPVLESIELKIR